MSETKTGMLIGAIVAFFLYSWGFGAMVVVVLFMIVGGLLGRATAGKLDVRGAFETLIGRHNSTSD